MNDGGALERVALALIAHESAREQAQLVVDNRHQLFERARLARPPILQEHRYVRIFTGGHESPLARKNLCRP